jgi:uncharacterized protein YjbJ (UPF0337 family)
MNKDTVKGAVDQAVGSAKSHVGHLTGNTGTEVKGAVQQIKGQVESAVGHAKDAIHDAQHKAEARSKACNETKCDEELAGSHKAL